MAERHKHEIIYLGIRVGKNDAKVHAFKVVKLSTAYNQAEFYYENKGKMAFTLFGLYTIEGPDKEFTSYFEKSLSGFIGSAKSQLSKAEAQEAFEQHITANGYLEELTNTKAMRIKAKEYTIRAGVLNLTLEQWQIYKTLAGKEDSITITVDTALKLFGAMGTLSAKTNSEEREFIDHLYKELRQNWKS